VNRSLGVKNESILLGHTSRPTTMDEAATLIQVYSLHEVTFMEQVRPPKKPQVDPPAVMGFPVQVQPIPRVGTSGS